MSDSYAFRRSMALLHTWAGLPFSWVLFIVFVTGSLTYFRTEISVWMQPELHSANRGTGGIDRAFALLQSHAPNAVEMNIYFPDERRNTIYAFWLEEAKEGEKYGKEGSLHFDPATGEVITPRETDGAYLPYRIHYGRYGIGYTGVKLVYISAMGLLITLITGLIIHRTPIKDFFTFRPHRGRLSWRDLHNAASVLALPFHIVLCFSSLLIAFWLYFPNAVSARYGEDISKFFREAFLQTETTYAVTTDVAIDGDLISSLKPLLTTQPHGVARILIKINQGERPSVEVFQPFGGELKLSDLRESMVFDGVSGELAAIKMPKEPPLSTAIWNTVYSIHVGRFALPLPRFLLFFSGLIGALMFASGLILWTDRHKPRTSGEKPSLPFTLVSVLNIVVISGLLVALGAYFWSNRLIPAHMELRGEWEVHTFSIVWGLSLAHALVRRPHRQAWREQFFAAGLLFSLLPILNGLTGGAHLGVSITSGLWVVAGFDIIALFFGVLFFTIAFKLKNRSCIEGESI